MFKKLNIFHSYYLTNDTLVSYRKLEKLLKLTNVEYSQGEMFERKSL